MAEFVRMKDYTRAQISRALGGGVQEYLPHVDGRVVAGCFKKQANPDAPSTILPGTGAGIERWAEVFAAQQSPIPVFVKSKPNVWTYFGRFRCVSLDRDPKRIEEQKRRTGRDDVTMILKLERDKSLESGSSPD